MPRVFSVPLGDAFFPFPPLPSFVYARWRRHLLTLLAFPGPMTDNSSSLSRSCFAQGRDNPPRPKSLHFWHGRIPPPSSLFCCGVRTFQAFPIQQTTAKSPPLLLFSARCIVKMRRGEGTRDTTSVFFASRGRKTVSPFLVVS